METEPKKILSSMAKNARQAFLDDRTILSFPEYFDSVVNSPKEYLRSSAQYLVDMFDHYGSEELDLPTGKVTRFKLFDAEFSQGEGRVAGHEEVQETLYRLISNFAREGRVNKLILMHGPNGSAKSSLVRCLMAAAESYSKLPEGAIYSFNWIFPTGTVSGEQIGFGSIRDDISAEETYAYLNTNDIDTRVPSEMHDHPLFLIPRVQRLELLREFFPAPEGSDSDDHISDYFRNGDLSHKNRRIYDALLASYDGDISKVLKHIQIERFYFSRRYRRGIATVEPQMAVDAKIQQVTADRSLTSLPKALQHTALFEPMGPLVDSNRGILEFSDFLKRPVEAFKYLLSTVETGTVTMDSFVLHLDMIYLASTNEKYLDAFKEHHDFPSFKGRIELVKVPYLRRYGEECEIYRPVVNERTVGRHIAPHAIEIASLWTVLTRMRRNDPKRYSKEVGGVIEDLSPIDKMRLYDTGDVPVHLSARLGKELKHIIPELYRESSNYPNYEGRFGASAREIRTAMLNAAHSEAYQCLSPFAVLSEIEAILESKSVYDFLKQDVVGKFHDHRGFLEAVNEIFLGWIDDEIRDAMGLAEERSYGELFSKYINHVSHWVKQEKLQDKASGDFVDPDQLFMREIEKTLMGDGEKEEDFRKSVIGTIGARALDIGETPDYEEIFKGYVLRLKEAFYSGRREELRSINENIVKFTSEEENALEPKEVEQSREVLARLEERYGYCEKCARDAVMHLLKHRYEE